MQQNMLRIQDDYEGLVRDHRFELTHHAEQRLFERSISWQAVFEVLECYSPVEWADVRIHQSDFTDEEKQMFHIQPYRIVVCGESDHYDQPIAVVCSYDERPVSGRKREMRILTAYFLDKAAWTKDLSRRLCFCPKNADSRYVQNMIAQYCRGGAYQSSTAYSSTR